MMKKNSQPWFLLASVFLLFAGTSSAQTWILSWSDEFNGPAGSAPSSSNWTYDTGGGGFGNNELEIYCSPGSNTSPCSSANPNIFEDGNGNLVIKAINQNGSWTSGRLKTEGIRQFQYGRIEARIKLTAGDGLWPAFWMLGTDINSVGWPQSGEQDIMEWVPQYGASTTSSTIHGPGYSGANGIGSKFTLPNGERVDDSQYHVYGVIWSPNQIQFYRDTYLSPFFTVTPSNIPSGDQWVFNNPFFILLNLAVGGDFPSPGPDSSTPDPATMLVDYVRVYTPGPGPQSNLNGLHVVSTAYNLDFAVDDFAASTKTGNVIDVFTVNGTGAQSWNFSNVNVNPSGDYNLAVSFGAFCVDVLNSGTSNGTKIDLAPCNGQPNQSWKAVPSGAFYTLQPANAPGSCLDSPSATTTPGTQLQIWQCTGGSNQLWQIQ